MMSKLVLQGAAVRSVSGYRAVTQLHSKRTDTKEAKGIQFSDNLSEEMKTLMKKSTVSGSSGEDVIFFVKHTNRLLEYTPILPSSELRSAMKDHNLNVKEPGHRSTAAASASAPVCSVEDYLYTMPKVGQTTLRPAQMLSVYSSLSKSKLTMLVVLTAMGGYALAPGQFDAATLLLLTVGTTLQSASANSTNQAIEVKYDSQMKRTQNRVLVRGLISRQHAATFAAVSGILGTSILYLGVNPLTCYIGMANHLLYTCIYTPMKRVSITNTWIGSVVGALPPLMGWSAATGSIEAGGLWLATLLYIWQFPHFKSLSWNVKADYQRAGYIMSSIYNPDMCKAVAFRHTLFMTAACCLGPAVGATTNMFIAYSVPFNLYGVYLGWRFYSDGDGSSARRLFRFSLIQIPYLIVMMLVSKKWSTSDRASAKPHAVLAT